MPDEKHIKCPDCGEYYEEDAMPFGKCPDCQDDFDSMDLEDRIESLL